MNSQNKVYNVFNDVDTTYDVIEDVTTNKWTEQEITLLVQHHEELTAKQLTKLINRKCGKARSLASIQNKIARMGLHKQ